jgi:leucine dehydrogenase
MSVFDSPVFDEHEEVVFVHDPRARLRAIIAIHDSGPFGISGGGCRMWRYAREEDAIDDALRLSSAMTYKLALARIPAGGAKMVVLGDPRRDKTEALLDAIGEAVHRLRGRFVVGTDVGTSSADMDAIARTTPYVVRFDGKDPALATAYGVFLSIRWACARYLGRADLHGARVAIQGVGKVGLVLGRMLRQAGAHLAVTDVDAGAQERAVRELGADSVAEQAIYGVKAEVFAPCALGGIVDALTLPRMRCRVIAGSANNQLSEPSMARALEARGVLFVPDFVANMGGVIAASPFVPAGDGRAYLKPVEGVIGLLDEARERARRDGTCLYEGALALANDRVAERRERR